MMSWGTMFSVLNQLARAKVIGVILFCASTAWASAPYSQSELHSVEHGDEAKIRELRDQEIQQLRIVLGRRGPANRKADFYFRLSELYLEAYRSTFLLEGRVHEKRLAQGIPDSLIDRSHSRPYLSAGIESSQEILHFKIPFQRMDEVYYFLGFYYGEKEDREHSAHYFSELIQRFPRSVFVGPAAKEVGEYYYRKSQFGKALGFYELSLKTAKPEFGPSVLHKIAWCQYRTRQYERAIATMKQAIASCIQFGDRFLPLKDEALRDMAVLMTERGHVDEVIRYFQDTTGDPKLLPKILEKLGSQYERNVERAKAISVYDTLLKTHPDSISALRVFLKWTELEVKQRQHVAVVQRLRNYIIPEPSGSESDVSEMRDLIQNLRVLIRKTATEHHQQYRKKKNRPDLEVAELYYGAYLTVFLAKQDPHSEKTEIQMYLAEIKRDLGKFAEAVVLYREVLKSTDAKSKSFVKEAGFLWMASLSEAIKKQPHTNTQEPSALEKEFVEASDLVQQSQIAAGNLKDAQDTSLRSAQVLAGYSASRESAIQRIQTILSQWPKSKQAVTAAQLWIQLKHDHPSEVSDPLPVLAENAAFMATDQALNQGKIRNLMEEEKRKTKVAAIGKSEKERDFGNAAKGYEEFAQSEKDPVLADKAFASAARAYLKAQNLEQVLPLVTAWAHRFPQSKQQIEILRTLGTQALVLGNYELSAQVFEKLGTEYKESASLETSGRLYQGLNLTPQAHHIWNRYLELYRNSHASSGIALLLARSQEASHQDAEASRSYRLCGQGSSDLRAECLSRLADLYVRNKDIAQAKRLYQQVSAMHGGRRVSSVKASKKKTAQKTSKAAEKATAAHSDSSPYIGYARFRLAEMMESEANFEPMSLPEAHLQKTLAQRLSFLDPLSKAYQNVMQAGGPWGIAALHRLALFVLKFADEVDAIAPSPKASPAGVEKFKNNLKTVSQPLREKAKASWNEAYSRGLDFGLYSPYLPVIADFLADFKVQVPGRAQGPRGQFNIVGISANGGSEGHESAIQQVRHRLLPDTPNPAKEAEAWIDYGNLLWGEGKPLLAKLAYERSLALKPKNPAAINNLAVVQILSEGEEDWVTANEAAHLLEEALHLDDFFTPAKVNLAHLMNYYRNFAKAKPLWEQVLVHQKSEVGWKGLGIALQGLGKAKAAEEAFHSGKLMGETLPRFVEHFHEAGRISKQGENGAEECLSQLDDISESDLAGFEKSSVEHLKETCQKWKNLNKESNG